MLPVPNSSTATSSSKVAVVENVYLFEHYIMKKKEFVYNKEEK